jgi:carbon monoxide dehydrogenase subunit G
MFESIPNQKVVIGTFGDNSVNFDMEFLLFDLDKKGTNFKMVIKADLNPIMASMVSSSMEDLRDDFIRGMKEELGVDKDARK